MAAIDVYVFLFVQIISFAGVESGERERERGGTEEPERLQFICTRKKKGKRTRNKRNSKISCANFSLQIGRPAFAGHRHIFSEMWDIWMKPRIAAKTCIKLHIFPYVHHVLLI